MAVTGFSLLLAAVSALAGLAVVALPVHAETPAAAALVPGAALAATGRPPAEIPPADFTAAQYIDSAGCVFSRTGGGWLARTDPDGAPLCGFPPTLSARRSAFGNKAALFPGPDEPEAERIHRELAEAIIPNLQTGELLQVPGGRDDLAVSGAAPAAADADHGAAIPPGPATTDEGGTQGELGRMMALAPVLSAGMTRADHTDRLCALIGRPAHDTGPAGMGLCGSETAPAALPPVRHVPEPARAARRIATDEPAERGIRQPGRQVVRKDAAATGTEARPAASLPRASQEMIPPGTRYLQVGVFSEAQDADRLARKLAGLGLPVARSRDARRGRQLILVGPLDGREAIVRMIDRLGRAGFHNVVARR